MMNRSFGYANNNRNSYNNSWRNSSSLQDQGSDRKILDLIEKIRSCKPYLQKRLKIIEESGQTKLLREEVQDISYWLEIAQEVRADLIYGVETLEVVHEKMMDMIRLHPIQGAVPASRLEQLSDDDSDSAPRSPSPVGSSSDFALSTKIIPLESSQAKNEWERNKADFLPNSMLSGDRRPAPDRGFNHYDSNVNGNEWPSSSNFEYTRRGDTDMRVNPNRFEAFGNGRPQQHQQQRPGDLPRPFEDPRVGASNSPWMSNNNDCSPWDVYHNNGPRPPAQARNRGDENLRDYDYRDRGREPSPERTRYQSDRRPEDDRGRQYFRDQDFRDLSRSSSRDDRPRDRSHDSNRDRSHEREWTRPNERPDHYDFDPANRVYRDRDSRDSDPRRREFSDSDNREQWSNQRVAMGMGSFNGAQVPPIGMPPNPAFLMNASPQPLMGINPHEIPRNSQNAHNMNMGMINRGVPQAGNIHANPPSQPRNTVGMGPQSPPQYPTSFAPVPTPRPGLLPTPPRAVAPNFGMPYQPPTAGQVNTPRINTPVGPNPFDPRTAAADFADQFRQKAQQHFASKVSRPRPPVPRPPAAANAAPAKPSVPPTAPNSAPKNPNLATNQIVADLPSDPRRRSQLQKLQQQMQQKQQQQTTTNSAPADSTQRRASTPPKEKEKEKTEISKPPSNSKNVAEMSPRNSKRPAVDERKDTKEVKDSPKRNIHELRKTLSKQGFVKLGTKNKNFEEAEPESEQEETDKGTKDREEKEMDKKKSDSSPTRNQAKLSPRESNRKSERVARHKEQKAAVSTDDEEHEGRRRSTRTRKISEDDKRSRKHSTSEDEEKEKEAKGKCTSKPAVPEDGVIPHKSVLTFRIPKIKRPEPPPPPPPPPPQEEPEVCSPLASPSSPQSEHPDTDERSTMKINNKADTFDEFKLPGSSTTVQKATTSAAMDNDQGQSSSTVKSDGTDRPAEKGENLAASTNFLLRQFMAKSVGLSGDILEQIIANPSAMDKIKSLLKDHVSEIVGKDASASPARTDTDVRVVKETKEVDEEDEVAEDGSEVTESPAPTDEEEVSPQRGRTMVRKRANKRRSSLEKLHDALREMNFDAVLPLGPRRAVNARSEEHGDETSSTVAESIQSVIDNVVSETNVEAEKSSEELLPESSVNEKIKHVPVKRAARGKKRQAAGGRRVANKRTRKQAGSVAVTEKDAIAAVAAIPDPEVLAQSLTPPHSADAGAQKKRPRSVTSKAEGTKSPAKAARPTRPLPPPDAEVRITRSMIRPSASTTDITDEVPLGNKIKVEEPVASPENSPEEVEAATSSSPAKPRPRQYKAKKKTEVVTAAPEPPTVTVAATEVKQETPEVETNPHVFVYDEEDGFHLKEQIDSHNKLLNIEQGASIIVKKFFPDAFDAFLNNVLGKDVKKKAEETGAADIVISEKLLRECKETLDWMVSVVQFREYNVRPSSDVDLSDLASNDSVSEKTSEVFRRIVLSSDGEESANGKDDEEEEEESEEQEDVRDALSETELNQSEKDEASRVRSDVDSVISDEDDSKSVSILPSQESNDQSNDVPSKDDIDEREGEAQEDEERDVERKKNLEGNDLYRCANRNCEYSAPNGALFKDHALNCNHSEDSRNLLCFHCERRLKSIQSLMEHMKIHGTPRQLCSLCNFRGWFNSELSKHMKNAHKVYNCKVLTEAREGEDPVYIMYPKGIAGKLAQPQDLSQNHILYTSKVQFQPTDIESVPKASIFTSLAHCALCDYSTKVRSNIIRHLQLHARSEQDGGVTKVPAQAPVNPVPCLERKELMFDKMTNWAGSSHANKVGGVSKEDTLKLPKFVVDQFRYVCSVSSCKQVTGQDDILCAHMKALHFKEKYYVCPHCQEEEGTKNDLRNTVLIEKIPHHLKLHGPRLSKCGHCDYIHFSSTSMEKHVATKHVEKKPIFYLIRDFDNDGNALVRRASTDDPAKGPNERWKCTLCRAQLNCWDEAKNHCSAVHKIENQFECIACHYGSDSIYAISTHVNTRACKPDKVEPRVMIMFLRGENFEATESKNEDGINVPIWRRDAPRVKHIRGIFLDDENIRPSSSKSNAPKSVPATPATSTSSSPATAPKPPAPQPPLLCPKCNLFKAKSAKDLKVHLFNELNYQRYKCTICKILFVTVESLKAHMNIDHKVSMEDEEKSLLPVNKKLETEVYDMISGILNAQKTNLEDKDGRNIENLLCKHCYLQFSSYHNYRTHILAKHIGSERFRCKYCNMGFWHEAMVKQHHYKSPHASMPLSVVRDNEFEQMLTPDFWFKEYGIPLNKSVKSASIGRPEDECGSASPSKYTEVTLQVQDNSQGSGKSPTKRTLTKRRSVSIASDTDKEEEDPLKLPSSPKRCLKHLKELANVYKCEHCLVTNFTKRGMRSHWSRSHGMEELPCRYYECPSFDDNHKLNDGYVLKCSTCPFQTSSVEHFQTHHEVEHPGKAFRFKRRKRNELAKNAFENATVVICNYCFCELETVRKCQNHCQEKHPGSPLDYRIFDVSTASQADASVVGAKLIEDNVLVECPVCSKSCGNVKQYVNHYTTYHDSPSYQEPVLRFSRAYGPSDESANMVGSSSSGPPRPKIARRILTEVEDSRTQEQPSAAPVVAKKSKPPQPTVLYECPKCDFKSDNMDLLCGRHLITHLLAYRCPECDLAFHLFLDALFHIRHFHGIARLRPSHNGEAYVEFSSLKDRITKVDVAPRKNVILVNLSDDEDFDDTPTVYPIPNPGDLDELDVEDARMLLDQ